MNTFEVVGNDFVYNGQPMRLLSGAIHYFRIVPEYWEDRLLKLKALGLNTVETYIPWNLHEPQEGFFDFTGIADVVAFIQLAGSLGLHVIVRPSPYICAEWEFGGLPAWLLADQNMRLRSYDISYLDKVDAYYDVLLPLLQPLLCTKGGPIIAMQIENEYGSYGNDTAYLQYIQEAMVIRGMDVLLFTSDGPEDFMLQGGMVPGVLATVNFGSNATSAFAKLKQYQPDAPLMVMEFWDGWFDHWMEPHQTRSAQDTAETVDDILRYEQASLNFYMFHGGTNFGFYNGANHIKQYEPTVGSYDYGALLNEQGQPTDKFFAVREVLGEYIDLPALELPVPIPTANYGTVTLHEYSPLLQNLDVLTTAIHSSSPEPMEKLGQAYGFILYSTIVKGSRTEMELVLQQVSDRAIVYVDETYQGIIERWTPSNLPLEVPEQGIRLDILVENMGRINYGPYLRDPKGITEGVRHGNAFLYDWTIYPLPLHSLSDLIYTQTETLSAPLDQPAFYRGIFHVQSPADTFLRVDGWVKGVVFLNGFNLGRYWQVGPQKTLYIPAPLLKQGDNELILFELHGYKQLQVQLVDTADLGQ
ncbi:beta-galactosidase [Paenibacillus kyungheensis]|uniref:beta-galactosidase n=1 Tax=Paenibacillus kyungheensis TaxID=1452732 RepID=A0AAX3M1H6_9BACL|nr:beta-galactosidase family protein [Paenibacillus kyungheensis]WCT55808.1 beta-galactosidase [Paenibacillus kyungheensis]